MTIKQRKSSRQCEVNARSLLMLSNTVISRDTTRCITYTHVRFATLTIDRHCFCAVHVFFAAPNVLVTAFSVGRCHANCIQQIDTELLMRFIVASLQRSRDQPSHAIVLCSLLQTKLTRRGRIEFVCMYSQRVVQHCHIEHTSTKLRQISSNILRH